MMGGVGLLLLGCSHCRRWSRTGSGQLRIVSIALRTQHEAPARFTHLPLQMRLQIRRDHAARKVC